MRACFQIVPESFPAYVPGTDPKAKENLCNNRQYCKCNNQTDSKQNLSCNINIYVYNSLVLSECVTPDFYAPSSDLYDLALSFCTPI